MERMLSDKRIIFLFIAPGLLFYAVFYLLPILFTTQLSLTQWDGVSLKTMRLSGIGNFRDLLAADPVFWIGIKNSLVILFVQVAIQVPLSIAFALILDACARGVKLFKTAFFIPVLFSATAVGLLWSRVYDTDNGLINRVLASAGIGFQQNWLSSGRSVLLALTVPMVWRSIGYYLIILFAAVKSIPKDYFEAALIDGCRGFQAAMKITLPLMRNAIVAATSLSAVAALREYPLIYVMTNGGPFNSSSTPAIQMYIESFLKMRFGYGSSIAIVLVAECLVVAWLIRKALPERDIQY